MPPAQLFDIESLLGPISVSAPAGVDLRKDASPTSPYQQIRRARSQARAIERRKELGDDAALKQAPAWSQVMQLAQNILKSHSKDLEITTYLIEASIREYGFKGLANAFQVARRLIDQYWDTLYPALGESGISGRLAQFSGLNGQDSRGTLIDPILDQPITSGHTERAYSTAAYLQARQLAVLSPSDREHRIKYGAVTMEMVDEEISSTPPEFFDTLKRDLHACLEEYQSLTETLQEKCGSEAPHTSQIREALETVADSMGFLTGSSHDSNEELEETDADVGYEGYAVDGSDFESPAPMGPPVAVSGIRSREEALRILTAVSLYFSETEPHSPLASACRQLVRWGRLPLDELYKELIPDPNARQYLFTLVGIKETKK